MTSGTNQTNHVVHPAELHARLQARADELAARSAERREARARRARSRGRRGLIATFGAVTLLLTGAIYALGVHDEGFQLEGNVEAADLTFVDIDDAGGGQPTLTPGTLTGAFAGPFDWDSLFDANGDEIVPRPAGFADATFVVDYRVDDGNTPGDPSDDSFDTSDGTQFTTGSKDTLDVPEWSCVGGNQVTNKGDIINAYVALFDSAGGDRILYFGIEKFAGNGDNNVGIWLLQGEVGCPPDQTGNGTPFSGEHEVGDLFMVAEITNGGGVSSIVAYEWIADIDPGPDVVPGLDEDNPVASGADCLDDSTGGDDLCAATNGEEVGVPWPHASSNGTDGLGGEYDPVAFLEGGINLSNFEEFADTCFTGFLFNTRSSQELGATLFDWTLGDINTCGSKSGEKVEDLDGDGTIAEDAANDLPGWTINLYADDGTTAGTLDATDTWLDDDVTDASGDYSFGDLFPGDYIVCEESQPDWFQSYPNAPVTESTNSCDALNGAPTNPGGEEQEEWGYAFTISSGEDDTGNDFGNFQQGSKSGTKFDDPNGDGDLTDGTGLENWVINAYADDGDGTLSALEYAAGAAGTDTTDANGDYLIEGLDPGDYIACEVLQADWFQSFPSSGADCTTDSGATDLAQWGHAFTVTSGSSEEDNDFGNFQQGSKSGTKFDDPNGDGDLTDGTGLENWVINAYADDGDGTLSALEYAAGAAGTDTTDANGDYLIEGLDPGDYIACEVLQADWFQSFPSSGADCTTDSGATDLAQWGHAFTVTSGSSEEDNDFGNFQQGSKSGTKFDDPNGDGDLTDGTGLENWVINAYADDGDGTLSALEYAAGAAGTDTTDANGDYLIEGLDPGDYIACEVLQADWFQSFPSSGADCTTDSGATDLAQWGHAFTVTSGSSEEDNDFGNFQQGSKSGTKFDDPNGDGDLTDGTGLENWVINAYADDGDGTLSALEYAAGAAGTDTTDANGDYLIEGLDPGDYIACEVLQADWFQSFPSSGADCTTDSGATDLAQWGHAFTVTSGSSEEDNDFGNFQQGSKSGTKFDDPNGDGDLTDGTGLENWVINAYADDGDGTLSALEYAAGAAGTDTTDANGDYLIEGLDPGDYIACEVLQADWFQSFPSSGADCTTDSGATDLAQWGHAFTVTSGSSEEDNDFGNFQQGSKSGTKFDDPNGDGDLTDGTGLENWVINAYADDGDGTLSALEYAAGAAGTDTTDANGDYLIEGLDPGDYIACEVLQADWFQSFPSSGADCTTDSGATDLAQWGHAFTVTSGSSEEDNDFGNFQQGSKSGTKFDDPNGDGDLTDGTGLENWVINAYADDGDGTLSALEYAAGAAGTDTTDANGDYLIEGLDPGDYIACEVLQADWFQSFPSSGADCTTDSGATDLAQWGHAFTVTSGSSEEDNDFGNFQQGSKSGTKFDDMANHGVWDLGEPGLADWTIHLFGTDGQGTAVHLTAVTDANGLYTFTGLNPGSYTVCEELQTGWTQSFPTTGADCTGHTDGGTIIPGPLGYAITITSGEEETGNDFGNFLPSLEGCTPGFWQGGVGIQLWNTVNDPEWTSHGGVGSNPFIQSQTFVSFFPSSGNTTVDNMTMIQIVGSGGTNVWERKAARDLIAAYLNASFGIDYPYDTTTILADWNTAVAGGTQGFKDFHAKYDLANNLGCPL